MTSGRGDRGLLRMAYPKRDWYAVPWDQAAE
jgi:hypothetical protein